MASTERMDRALVDGPRDRLLERIPWVSSDGLAVVERVEVPVLTWANPSLHHLLDASAGTLIGIPLHGVPLVPVTGGPAEELVDLVDHLGTTSWWNVLRNDGSALVASVVLEPLSPGPDGPWLMTVREVSEQVRADELLRTSEARFRALAAHAPIGVALSDVGVRLGYVNERLAEAAELTLTLRSL